MYLNATDRETYLQESPISLDSGSTTTIAIRYWGVPSSASAVVKKVTVAGETDVTSTVMTSGAVSVSGSTLTLKPLVLAAANAGYEHIVYITATVNSDITVKRLKINVPA